MAIAITDPMQVPQYRDSWWHRLLIGVLYDPRDEVFLRLTLKSYVTLIPLLVAMFIHFHWALMAAFLLIGGWYLTPVILMLHNTMHRPFIKRGKWVNRFHCWSMCLLFGIPPGYMEHHVGMHHVENNVGEDLSATWRYQRDNFFHWLHYFARFFFLITLELPAYLRRHKRTGMARSARVTGLVQMSLIIFSCWYDLRIGLLAFVLPWFATRLGMMLGNWGQHAFIDPARPGDSLVNSITCINTGYNQRCFNDGYHIGHHVKANRHWAEMPADFLASLDTYAKAGSIVFDGVDFFFVSILLFLGRYDVLAKKFVPLDGRVWSQDEIIAFLKSRTRPVVDTVPTPAVPAAV